MRIGVFCSANSQIDPDFFMLTRQLGEWIGNHGHTLVYGGCDLGLMECIAQAVSQSGGQVIGIIPSRLEKGGHTSSFIDVRILCETLGERKQLMVNHSDVVIALPGGIGTLDEIFSVASEGTLAYHDKAVVVYNMKGFWNELRVLMEHLQQQGLIRGDYRSRLVFADTIEDVVKAIVGKP